MNVTDCLCNTDHYQRLQRRIIMHADCNCFYASVEMARNPDLAHIPMAVAGDPSTRHGIILAKNSHAKRAGVQTGEPIWQARKKCPTLFTLPPRYPDYQRVSREVRQILYHYTNLIEPFGIDECWLDLTPSAHLFGGDPTVIAEEIGGRIKRELGITVSIGISWNKIFAKFGSDIDQGDGIVEITPSTYREIIWPHPIEHLLYVGHATSAKLKRAGIHTIGELAFAPRVLLTRLLGRMGAALQGFALGFEASPVKLYDPTTASVERLVKSVGNGFTTAQDIIDPVGAYALIYLLTQSVAQRLRSARLVCSGVSIGVRHSLDLSSCSWQTKLRTPTCSTQQIANAAFNLLKAHEPLNPRAPLRALHVHALSLMPLDHGHQLHLFGDCARNERCEQLDFAIDTVRNRFGNRAVISALELVNASSAQHDVMAEHTIHPVSFFAS